MPAIAAVGISAGVGLWSAHKGAQAAKQASNVQVQASDKAMAYQQQQQQQAMQYAERMRTMPLQGPAPGGAQSYLSKLMGIPSASGYGAPSGAPPLQPTSGYQFQPAMGQAGSGGSNMGYASLMGVPRPVGGGMTPAAAQNSGSVMIQAPNGQTRAVPADQADHYISLGGRRVG